MGNFACPVNIALDLTVGIWMHEAMSPPAVPAPVKNVSFEMLAPQLWLPGYMLNQNKLTSTVFHWSTTFLGRVVLDGHNQGYWLIHGTLPVSPNILLFTLIIPFSSRKIAFTASTVKFNGKAVGCSCIYPIFPMMTCGDPCSFPSAFPIINSLHSLKVGISVRDTIVGWLNIAISIAVDMLIKRIKRAASVNQTVNQQVNQKIVDKLNPFNPKNLLKEGLKSLGGLAVSLLTDNPTFKLKVGSDYYSGELKWSKDDGWTESVSIILPNLLPYKVEHSAKGWGHTLLGEKL